MISMRLLALAALLLAGMALPVQARTEFPVEGGRGDVAGTALCGPGEYLVGVQGRAGAWIDRLKLICAKMMPNGMPGDRRVDAANFGGDGGSPVEAHCGSRSWVAQAKFAVINGSKQLSEVTFQCYSIQTGEYFQTDSSSMQISSGYPTYNRCPPGEIAVGLNLRWGRHVNAAGLICDKLVVPAAPPPPKPDPLAAADKNPSGKSIQQCEQSWARNMQRCLSFGAKALASRFSCEAEAAQLRGVCSQLAAQATGGSTAPAGKKAQVALPVDVYDAPGGNGNVIGDLAAGANVTVVAEEGNSWFRVQGNAVPGGDGYVYSGEGYRSLQF